jgi:predicted enzyme related to lactoylglutathione lyase
MSDGFVWFHHGSDDRNESKDFYAKLLGWTASEGPGGMTMLAVEKGPFAAAGEKYGDAAAWIPFVQVQDVDTATKKAVKLGGRVIREKAKGPAGEFSVVRDPGGAAIGLWQKA